jgi:SDR family mycofactocin-dependent oxidoreductase
VVGVEEEETMGQLDGKVTFITGAARGQGRSHAMAFAEEGADLALIDLCADVPEVRYPLGTAEQLEETARRCRERGARVWAGQADVRDAASIEGAVARAIEELGRIDILINNAGISSPAGPTHALTEEGWAAGVDINLSGVWRTSKAVLPHMIERGAGCIIHISSSAGLRGMGGNASYVAAKHGVIGLTKSMAIDYAPNGITVNAVCPGSVRDDPDLDSAMLRGVAVEWEVPLDEYEEVFAAYHLLPTLMEARDISRACVWLASPDARRATGTILSLDAGMVVKAA